MHNNSEKNSTNESDDTVKRSNIERRKKQRSEDPFFRLVVILNICAWISLLSALILFHYARPEFISGVQKFWGIEGRIYWSQEHVSSLVTMLQVCLGLALVSTILRSMRNRRKQDNFGINLLILLVVSIISLATLYTSVMA